MSEQPKPSTLKEFRELRGMSVEELADESGVPAQLIERWEEVGMDAAPVTRKADYFADHQLAALGEVLSFDSVRVPFAASEAEPGDMVITVYKRSESLKRLVQEALETEGVELRIAVPTERWGVVLKNPDEVTLGDQEAIANHEAEETAHNEERLGPLTALLELMERGGEDVTVEETLEQADQELSEDLDRLQEDEQGEEPGTA